MSCQYMVCKNVKTLTAVDKAIGSIGQKYNVTYVGYRRWRRNAKGLNHLSSVQLSAERIIWHRPVQDSWALAWAVAP